MGKKIFGWLLLGFWVANCVPRIDDSGLTPVETGKACAVDANCDDDNVCTNDVCSADTKVCEYTPLPSGPAPDFAQTPEDCKTVICKDGQPSEQDDPADFIYDNNSCTKDLCVTGVPINEVLPDNTACNQGPKLGTCAAGTCKISCQKNADCNDSNPCTEDLCNTSDSACIYTNLDGLPTPGITPVAGDCQLHICEGGFDKIINDDADVFDDNNPCTDDMCKAGARSNPPIAGGTACFPGDTNVCDGNGLCVACTKASHCVNINETECEKRSCVKNNCEIAYQGNTTLASSILQTAGDCKKVVCNGAAGTTSLPDNADLPVDGNPCTKDICTNGSPSNPPEAQNFACGTNLYCNGGGNCVGCNMASQCLGTDDFCKTRTCTNNVCGFSYTANNTPVPTGQTTGDCKVIVCNGNGNTKTNTDQNDKPVDGDPCTQDVCSMSGTPSNPPASINTACTANGGDVCDGAGACKKSLGKTCSGNSQCLSAFCVDGVCCNSSCTTTCQSCNVAGNIGTCTDVPKGQDDGTCTGTTKSCNVNHQCANENGIACTGSNNCLSGFCVDGVCCESACTGTCKSCNVAGGTAGVCGNLPAGSTDNFPANICVGMNQCNGSGACMTVAGTLCSTDDDCMGGVCVDGICT